MSEPLEDVAWEAPPAPAATRRRRWPWVTATVLVLLALAYGGAAIWFGDRVARGTSVGGVDIGGQTSQEAQVTLERSLGDLAGRSVTLTSAVGSARSTAGDLGLGVDTAATVRGLTGFTLDPRVLWGQLVGGSSMPAVVTVDEGKFAAGLESMRGELDGDAVEGSLSIADGTVQYAAPVAGSTLDVPGTERVVRRWWPAQSSLAVAATSSAPTITAEQFERVRKDFADVAVSGPVTLKVGDNTASLWPRDFGPAITFEADASGRLGPTVDEAELEKAVHRVATEAGMESEAKDAVVTFSGTTPTVTPSVEGVSIDKEAIDSAVVTAISSSERTVTLPTTKVAPELTTERAKATLPKEKISSFTTYYPCCQARVTNIRKAASVVDGTYVLPGKQFSLNEILGDTTTKESGYVPAPIILNGRLATAYGGGLSQVSTTVFNAAFFSGMRLDEWSPHSYYISRYPEGREATLSWPDLQHIWTNTTDGGVLVKVSTTGTSITVDFYGQKKWDIEATKSPRYDIVQPETIVSDSPECLPQSPVPGFRVVVGRIFTQGGKVVKTESYTTRYKPEDKVTCTNPR